jgi:periplasmic protein TonB
MATPAETVRPRRPEVVTANDRLKESFNAVLAGCIAFAALAHYLVLAYAPPIATDDYSIFSQELVALDIPPQVEIPPPPRPIARPAVPVLSTRLDLSDDVTIQEVTFASNPVDQLPPPPTERQIDLSEQPAFTPRTVDPRLPDAQREVLRRYLERNYPASLLSAGIGARAVVWVFINEEGAVRNTRIVESSGYDAFDQVAQEALRRVTFVPAWNRDHRVPVWVQLPISWGVT